MGESFYADPSSSEWRGVNLVRDLMKCPATTSQHPPERQATVVVAWLLDRSRVFAETLLRTAFEGDTEVLSILASNPEQIGAQTWRTLRPLPQTGALFPDLSIVTSGRQLEVMIEVKIDASVHDCSLDPDVTLWQPDAYWASWHQNYDRSNEAEVRRIATLTKAGSGVAAAERQAPWLDLRWSTVHDILDRLLESGRIEAELLSVAIDARSALGELVLPVAKKEIDDPVLARGHGILTELAPRLAALLPGGRMGAKPGVYSDFVSVHVFFDLPDCEGDLWLYVTSETGKYAVPGSRAGVWIAAHGGWVPKHPERIAESGLDWSIDHSGSKYPRRVVPLSTVTSRSAGEDVQMVLDHLSDLLNAFGEQ